MHDTIVRQRKKKSWLANLENSMILQLIAYLFFFCQTVNFYKTRLPQISNPSLANRGREIGVISMKARGRGRGLPGQRVRHRIGTAPNPNKGTRFK